MAAPDAHAGALITHRELAGHTRVAIALAAVATLPALLLAGVPRACALAAIVLAVALVVDVYRFEVDPARRAITIRTLWWGYRERRSVVYAFSDVRSLRHAEFADGSNGYRWDFADRTRYELWAPVDPRLLELFLDGSR